MRIAELAYKMCYGGGNKAYVTFEGKKVTGIGEVRTLLLQRNKDIIANPELKETDRWTQATVFYRTRKILKDKGSRELKRASIISYIDDICRDELKKPREQLGIYAADRAQMYFKGRTFDVGFDEIQELLEKGTDLVIIEKEGAAQNLIPFANRYGCAILNTRGFLTDYAKMLSTEFFDKVKNMVIVTDFDVAGILIAKKLSKITRIGIDFDTIEHFGLNAEDVQEDYKPNEDHLKHLEEFGNIDEDLLDYLEKTRIEIDSITAQVGNQRFWNFIMDKLEKIFTTRDYTRAIDIPDYIAPKGIKEITDALAKKGSQITENLRDEITKEMENVEGFKDTQQTQIEINDRIASKILEDSDIKSFIIDLENIKTKYDWLNY